MPFIIVTQFYARKIGREHSTCSLTEVFLNMATNLLGDFNEFSTQAIQLLQLFRPNTIKWMTPLRPLTSHVRHAPHSTTVHTILIKKITYLMTSRPDELWILERTTEGMETWRPIETFLENLHLTHDPRALRVTANQWRLHFDVPAISPSTPASSLFPVLPHPEHSNVHSGQPVSAVPDHTYIFSTLAGDDPRSTTLKALLFHFIGHHGDRLHLLHQPEQLGELQHNQ